MSIIQRPTKQGNATTYQGKVAAGYTKILAAEVDADLDLIYSAWNQGVDTVNIQPGAITGDKLAAGAVGTRELQDGGIQTVDIGDAQVTTPKIADGSVTQGKLAAGVNGTGPAGGDLTGSYPNPALSVVQGGVVSVAPRTMLLAGSGTTDLYANVAGSPSYDATKSTWLIRGDYVNDLFQLWRAAPNGGVITPTLTVDAKGFITAHAWGGGRLNTLVQAGLGSGASNIELTLPSIWYDNGSGISTANGNHLTVPAFPSGLAWCMVNGVVDINTNAGFGFGAVIQQQPPGGGFGYLRQTYDVTQTSFSVCVMYPLPSGTQLRLCATNATGASVDILYCSLSMVAVGQ